MYYIYKQASSPIKADPNMSPESLESLMVSLNKVNPESVQALSRLLLLRDYYNDGWTPDYKSGSTYRAIVWDAETENVRLTTTPFPHILTFECPEIASKFLEKHREAIRSFFSLIPGVF